MSVESENYLPAARQALSDAVHQLAGRTTITITADDGTCTQHYGDSLYEQLLVSTGGVQRDGGGEGAHSQPPIWIDGVQLLSEIDVAVRREQPDPGSLSEKIPETMRRLYLIDDRLWRVQDTGRVYEIADACVGWAGRIVGLFDPPARRSLPNPCPACGAVVVYRRDSGGEVVRQPALQIGSFGCECMRCHVVWGPERFQFLARVLGYGLPEGVLE